MAIKEISIISLPVADQARAIEFYVEKLGFEVRMDAPMGPDMRWVTVAPKGGTAQITLVSWDMSMKPGSVAGLILDTDDVDGDYATCKDRGVEFSMEPKTEFWGRFTEFKDPDGNHWMMVQSAPVPAMA